MINFVKEHWRKLLLILLPIILLLILPLLQIPAGIIMLILNMIFHPLIKESWELGWLLFAAAFGYTLTWGTVISQVIFVLYKERPTRKKIKIITSTILYTVLIYIVMGLVFSYFKIVSY